MDGSVCGLSGVEGVAGGKETIRKVGAQGESVVQSLLVKCSGTRTARVQTTEPRLRFSMVVMFHMPIWTELRVIPAVKKPKRADLDRVRFDGT